MLNIAVVAYNYDLSCKAIRELVESDMGSKPKHIRKNEILMEDGTRYKAFHNAIDTRGKLIDVDQIILVDDSRWMVYIQQYEIIDYLISQLHLYSRVPEEFQILKYEW